MKTQKGEIKNIFGNLIENKKNLRVNTIIKIK